MDHETEIQPPRQSTWQWDLLAGGLPAISLAPLLVFQAADLSSNDHMQFFPVVFLVLIPLVALRMRGSTFCNDAGRMWIAISLLALGAALYAYAVWIFSFWLAHLISVIVFAAWGLGRLGHLHWGGVAGLALLMATTLPLPWNWDRGFSNALQTTAAWGSAKALDALAVPCLQNGGLIETREMQISADEVCGGVASVYALAAFAVFISLIQHSSFLVGLLTLMLVPLWALVGHFLRIFGILMVHEIWERDLASGWDFRILELVTSFMVVGLVWCSSRFLGRLFEPIPVADAEFGPVFSGLNKLFCWPQPDPFEELEPDDEYERERYRKSKQEKLESQRRRANFAWLANSLALSIVCGASVLFLIGATLPTTSLASHSAGQLHFGRPSVSPAEIELLAKEDALPASLNGGWQRLNFQVVRRHPRSRQGEYNLVWRYQLEENQFDATLKLPFSGWNEPADELKLRGWKLDKVDLKWQNDWPFTTSRLENELGGKALLIHSLFTSDGKPFANVPKHLLDEQTAPPGSQPESPRENSPIANAETYQFVLFRESGAELSRTEREALETLFVQLRDVARKLVEHPAASDTLTP